MKGKVKTSFLKCN